MKKNKINFYKLDECKTEFLFESDAEKAVLAQDEDSKKPKLYKKIAVNCILICLVTFGIFYGLSSYETKELNDLYASVKQSEFKQPSNKEKMNSSSDNLKLVSINNNKYEIIINKANPISKETLTKYNTVSVEDNLFPNVKLEEQTYKNYLKLKDNLLERGYYINIRSGYRSFEDSEKIYNYYSMKNGASYAEKYVAKPGVSEHNAGIAFDFVVSKDKNATKNNYESDEYFYLENIAYLYGFIIRYPKDKENITGYEYEPWHLRYVGTSLAKYLKKNNLTLEEYYETKE